MASMAASCSVLQTKEWLASIPATFATAAVFHLKIVQEASSKEHGHGKPENQGRSPLL
jgi:hypothetical protein